MLNGNREPRLAGGYMRTADHAKCPTVCCAASSVSHPLPRSPRSSDRCVDGHPTRVRCVPAQELGSCAPAHTLACRSALRCSSMYESSHQFLRPLTLPVLVTQRLCSHRPWTRRIVPQSMCADTLLRVADGCARRQAMLLLLLLHQQPALRSRAARLPSIPPSVETRAYWAFELRAPYGARTEHRRGQSCSSRGPRPCARTGKVRSDHIGRAQAGVSRTRGDPLERRRLEEASVIDAQGVDQRVFSGVPFAPGTHSHDSLCYHHALTTQTCASNRISCMVLQMLISSKAPYPASSTGSQWMLSYEEREHIDIQSSVGRA